MLQLRDINENIKLGLLDLAAFSKQNGTLLKRENERAGTRFLLQELLKTNDFEITYTAFNKPYLKDRSEHISISHSHDKLAIILNKKENTGIDIELIRDKVKNIQHKFISNEERPYAENDVEKLITIWAAKETMYKIYGEKELEFRKNLWVKDFNSQEITGGIVTEEMHKTFRLIAETIDNYKLVYVLHEI